MESFCLEIVLSDFYKLIHYVSDGCACLLQVSSTG